MANKPKKKRTVKGMVDKAMKRATKMALPPPDPFLGFSRVPGTTYLFVAKEFEAPGAKLSLMVRQVLKVDWMLRTSPGCFGFELSRDEDGMLLLEKALPGPEVFRVRSAQTLDVGRYTLNLKMSPEGEYFREAVIQAWPL